MAQRLRMTNADYVAIAVSPALIMALVGSLVFFLIEVLYVGNYGVRLNYVFALFVFATVLIARIAIEFGSERAAMFSLPLGILTYLALMRFVEHDSSLSWLINLLLLAVVWWCAHKLTWDCTLIDDNEDASGEGLLGQAGLDETDDRPSDSAAAKNNELFATPESAEAKSVPWWRRLVMGREGPHTPGVWVLYFSLAALPLFGIGQTWIPVGDDGRRRYAFGLLAVYVAAALCLLVTTSFLGLRRYLRQRRVEMPPAMAATWVTLGAAIIFLVMFAAALLPRPGAEYAISQAPWQARSPGDLGSSEHSLGREGTVDPAGTNRVTNDQQEAPPGNQPGETQESNNGDKPPVDGQVEPSNQGDESDATSQAQESDQPTNSSDSQQEQQDGRSSSDGDARGDSRGKGEPSGEPNQESEREGGAEQGGEAEESSVKSRMFEHSETPPPVELLPPLSTSALDVLKLLFYVVVAAAIAYFAWTRRAAIGLAIADIMRQLRELFARLFGHRATAAVDSEGGAAATRRRRTFGEFTDPFASGGHRNLPPAELVRYTFEAFEAWAGDRGRQRSPAETPQELVRSALAPQTPMYAQAKRLAQLYNEAAYSSATVTREAAASLQTLWQMMQSSATLPRGEAP